ncbi:hypothetical protein JCM10049v2_006385 [Rhodotorula toruloides]
MAIDDGRWEDLTTLFSILRACRVFYDVAAPLYWRSINLRKSYQYEPDDFLDTFSLRTRSFIRSVTTKAKSWVSLSATECATFAQIILELPNIEEIPVAMLDVYEQGSPGAAMYDQLAATVCHSLSSLEFEIVPAEARQYGQKHTVPPNIDLSAACGILAYLDPARLRRLILTGELTQAGIEYLLPHLQTFVHLEQYRLNVTEIDLALVTNIRAPLRSLELYSPTRSITCRASSFFEALSSFRLTLEHLRIFADLPFGSHNSPRIDLPRLRHLSLRVVNPIGLASRCQSSPLEILDLGVSFAWHSGESSISLLDLILSLQTTLEVVLVDDTLFDAESFRKDLFTAIGLRWTHNIWFLLPGEGERLWWSDLQGPDFYQRAKKTGGIGVISDDILESRWVHGKWDEEEEDAW